MKKRLLTSIVAFILVVSMGTVVALAAPAEDSQSERIGILYYGDDLKIVALQEDIDVCVTATRNRKRCNVPCPWSF